MSKKAAIYLRVSTSGQVDGFGLDAQRDQCEGMAAAKGWRVVETFSDEGVSGTLDADSRPGMAALMAAAERGEIEAVIFAALDRLGRSTGVVLGIVQRLGELDVKLVSCRESLDTSTPAGNFVLTMFAGLAQLDKDNTVKRLADGRLAKARSGQVIPHGITLYGYRLVQVDGKAVYEIDEEAAEVIRLIYDLYVNQGMSQRQIRERLTEERHETPAERNEFGRIREVERPPGNWARSTIRRILGSRAYTGKWFYDRAGAAIEVEIPAIISEETFEKAALRRRENSSKPKHQKYDYLLISRVRCGKCGRACRSLTTRGKYHYYRCGAAYNARETLKTCSQTGGFKADAIDATVWEWLYRLLKDAGELERALDDRMAAASKSIEPLVRKRDNLTKQLDRQRETLAALVTAASYGSHQITADLFRRQEATIVSVIEELERDLAEVEAQLKMEWYLTPEQKEDLLALAADFTAKVESGEDVPFEERRRWVEKFDVRAVLHIIDGEQGVEATCKLGEGFNFRASVSGR
jgi:site-specific DNA recombinase